MRTSVDLPDPLFRDLKILAARRGVTLRSLIATAVENELGGRKHAGYRVPTPLVPATGKRKITLTNAEIEDLLA